MLALVTRHGGAEFPPLVNPPVLALAVDVAVSLFHVVVFAQHEDVVQVGLPAFNGSRSERSRCARCPTSVRRGSDKRNATSAQF